jgi:anaerobic selenocysteine-containing dehydrogenase
MSNQIPDPNPNSGDHENTKERKHEKDFFGTDQYPFLVLAEKPAYGFFLELGTWNAEPGMPNVAIHARDAGGLGISNADDVRIETADGKKGGFKARLSEQVQPGTLLVDSNHAAARALFEITIDNASGMAIIPPSYAKLWRSE